MRFIRLEGEWIERRGVRTVLKHSRKEEDEKLVTETWKN